MEPPRGRGKAGEDHLVTQLPGITPAQAGKSRRCCLPGSPRRDHPRVGGEKTKKIYGKDGKKGSPPRGRGKGEGKTEIARTLRITPAWAGKSNLLGQSPWKSEDHPRVGGEKHQDESSVMELQGSPPRGRGKGPHHKYCHPFHRITPAWAGKSGTNNRPGGCTGDHPRVGGEKGSSIHGLLFMLGSPPRGRGKDRR